MTIAEDGVSPEAVFLRQVEAFNARDLEAYLHTFAPDAVVYGLSTGPPLAGREAMRAHYGIRLADTALHCEVIETFILPSGWLIARERITSSSGTVEVTAMFEIDGASIARAFLGIHS